MTKEKEVQIKLEKICEKYSFSEHNRILIEECAELIQAVSKYERYKTEEKVHDENLFNHILEEIADVEICIAEFKIHLREKMFMYEIKSIIEDMKDYKIDRQLKRLEK